MHKLIAVLGFLSIGIITNAQTASPFERASFIVGRDTLPYRVMYPLNYDAAKTYPLIVFLHGAGETGRDNNRQLKNGSFPFLDSANRKNFPAIVIFPQCSFFDFWSRIWKDFGSKDTLGGFRFPSNQPIGKSLDLVSRMLDEWAAGGKVDTKRIYIGGLSMGGMGTFELLWRKPNFFAAAFPICGGGDPAKVNVYAQNFPIWVFHGDADPTVPVGNSRLMVNALKNAGAKIKYTEYAGVKHNSWLNALAEPGLFTWLFSQKR